MTIDEMEKRRKSTINDRYKFIIISADNKDTTWNAGCI